MSGGEIIYQPRWRPGGSRVGAHRGRDAGGLGTFRDQVPFLRLPDARRIDIRATIRDPFEGTHVRRFETRTAIEVWALVDLSASMRFRGEADRMALVSELCTALAQSATSIGDTFGLIGFDEAIRHDAFVPATRRRAAAVEAANRIARLHGRGRGAGGVVDAVRQLAGRPKFVVLVSDFRWPEPLIDETLAALALHDVVPILLADAQEDEKLPSWGLVELEDLEGAGRRVVFLRPSLSRRWRERERERFERLRRMSSRVGRGPFRLSGRFDAEALSRHLMAT